MMDLDHQENAIAITELLLPSNQTIDLLVIGGGAAGFMSAISAAEGGLSSVFLFEATSKMLEKVRISGGGRCNVTNGSCLEPVDLVSNYPRGQKSLIGSFSRFSNFDAINWFQDRNLQLFQEDDGRIFPASNSSLDVISCLKESALELGVNCSINRLVTEIRFIENLGFQVFSKCGKSILAKRILLATGSNPIGRKLAKSLGHTIIKPVPSLFTFTIKNQPFLKCSGIALDEISLKLQIGSRSFKEKGRVLITHWGLSGPIVLRMSAFGARDFYHEKYKAKLIVNWIDMNFNDARELIKISRDQKPRVILKNANIFSKLPKRIWLAILHQAGIDIDIRCSDLSSEDLINLVTALVSSQYTINGKGPFGEEFVTAGGVKLSEVDLTKMESKIAKGLYFAGEVLDVDGITGGFNFQHCWTSGWLAGKAICKSLS